MPVSVLYNDGRIPNPETINDTIFTISTVGLDSQVSNGGLSIDYTSSGGTGNVTLVDGIIFNPLYLQGSLQSLSLDIIGPGAFEGSGAFSVTGGTLAQEFGDTGGLVTIGLSFTVPADFNNSFAVLANTQLTPGSAPIPSTFLLFGASFGESWRGSG